MTDAHARELIALGKDIRNELRRIASALEAANAADPVQQIAAALEHQGPVTVERDGAKLLPPFEREFAEFQRMQNMPLEERQRLAREAIALGQAMPDPHADLPPAQRRALGLD